MDFDFASGDDAGYPAALEAFLDTFDEWAAGRFGSHDGARRSNAGMFLDWNHNYRGVRLDTLTRDDLDEFLLGWLPGKYIGSSSEAPGIVHAVQSVVEYLALHDLLDGGAERAASLIAHTYDIADYVAQAMDDDTRFGMGKSLLGVPPTPNSEPEPEQEPQIPLPFVFVPSQPAAVETSAEASDVVRMVDGFAEHAAKHGIALTSQGNIEIADARELVAKLATGDIDDRVTSSLDFRWLTLIDDLASSSGAVERLQTQIRSDLAWFDLDATDKAAQLAQLVLHGGYLSSTEVAPPWLDEQRELLDDGVPHWVSLILVEGTVLPVEDVTTQALEVVAMQQPDQRAQVGADFFDATVLAVVGELFEGLERFGLVIWHGRDRSTHAGSGIEYSSGGEIELTPLGRHVFPDIVRQAGYTFDQVEGIEDASAQQMVRVALAAGLSGAEVLERWRTDLDLANRLELVAGCVIDGDAPERLVGFKVFNAADDPAMVAPIVRQLLDSPAGSYAADYLLDHDLATNEDVGAFINLTPVVDMLSVFGGDTEMFDQVFQNAAQMIDGDFIEELWRHDQAEVAWVLDTAGKIVTNKTLAKEARKAAIKHRSWLANQ